MKRICQFILMLLITASATSQTLKEADRSLIKALIRDSFQEIFSENEQEKLSTYYTEDFILLENGEVWDLKIIRSYMQKAAEMDRMPERINSFEFIEIKIEGKMAWAAYHNNAKFKEDDEVIGEMNWLESATAILTEEGWKLQMLHSTVVEEE